MSQPRLLFFSGGTALRAVSQELARQKRSSIHIISTFDSGGSSAALRQAFGIPAVGDMRNRLLALADRDAVPAPVLDFCATRLACDAMAARELADIAYGTPPLWQGVPPQYGITLRKILQDFLNRMPASFDARGACLGNLLLAESYLGHHRNFGPAIERFGRLLHVHGVVLPVVNAGLHLGCRLANGKLLVGQHKFKSLESPIDEMFLTVHAPGSVFAGSELREPVACRPQILSQTRAYLETVDAICYPMGSFYSSLLANLLPEGVGKAIAHSRALKIFIPNSGQDPELHGRPLCEQAAAILDALRLDMPDAHSSRLLQYMLVDGRHGIYPGGLDSSVLNCLSDMGIAVVDRPIVRTETPGQHDAGATLAALDEIITTARRF